MSGSSSPRKGKNSRHFQAARDWLNRAESQIDSGMDIMAASTLMLAQAELRLVVESIASGTVVEKPELKPRVLGFPPVSRVLLGGVAVAACLILGMAIGRMTIPDMGQATGQEPVRIVQAEIPENVTSEQVPVFEPESEIPVVIIDELDDPMVDSGIEAVAGTTFPEPVEEPVIWESPPSVPVSAPPVSHQPASDTSVPEETHPQPVETPPDDVSTPPSIEDRPHAADAATGEGASHGKISSAEVALRTILALSDRLKEGKN